MGDPSSDAAKRARQTEKSRAAFAEAVGEQFMIAVKDFLDGRASLVIRPDNDGHMRVTFERSEATKAR